MQNKWAGVSGRGGGSGGREESWGGAKEGRYVCVCVWRWGRRVGVMESCWGGEAEVGGRGGCTGNCHMAGSKMGWGARCGVGVKLEGGGNWHG